MRCLQGYAKVPLPAEGRIPAINLIPTFPTSESFACQWGREVISDVTDDGGEKEEEGGTHAPAYL